MLAKGTGSIVSEYISQKFNQIACIHAESYPSAEFRHGPLAMLDEDEKTACIFLILDDENLDQCLMNIMQCKDRGATITVVTNVKDIHKKVDITKIDHLVTVFPQKSMFAALLCCPPLLMIIYYTAIAKGINPDQNLVEALNAKANFAK